MKDNRTLIALIPWLPFHLTGAWTGADTLFWVALICAGAEVVIALRHPTVISITLEFTFVAIMVLTFIGNHAQRENIVHYGRGAAGLVLGLLMLASALTAPFDSVGRPRPGLAWSVAVLLGAAVSLVAGRLQATGGTGTGIALVLSVGVPLALIAGAVLISRTAGGPAGNETV